MRARAHPDRTRINQPARGNYLLINFNVEVLRRGIYRIIDG